LPAPRSTRRTAITPALLAAAIVALAAPSYAAAAEPIEGSWFFDGGEILVEPTDDGSFRGTVVRPTRLATCTHPAGERIWSLAGTGTHYTGTHQWFRTSTCTPNPGGQSTWDVSPLQGEQQTVRLCTRDPDAGGPPALNPDGSPADSRTHCLVLDRARPAFAPPTFRGVVVTPPARTRRGCGAHRRRIAVRLRNPKQDPLASVVVRVNGRTVRVLRGAAVRGRIVLRGLPLRRSRVTFVVRTASGRTLRGTRTFRACPR
jgi:hypothetical protein